MPTEFACTVDTVGVAGAGGVDYTSLSAWFTAMAGPGGTLVLGSRDPVVVPGALTGAVPDNSVVTQVGTGAQARLVHCTATQALLRLTSGASVGGNETGAWRVDASNYWTPSGPRDLAVVTASCRGATADTSALDFTKVYSQSNANPLVIRGDLDPTNLVWDATKFRWEFFSASGIVNLGGNSENLVLRNLQVRNTNSGTSNSISAVNVANRAAFLADGCIFRGGKNPVYIGGGQGRNVLHNCVVYGGTAAGGAVYNQAANAPVIARNCTLIGGAYGLRSDQGGTSAAENTYAYGATAAFAGAAGTTVSVRNCASNDATAGGGANLAVLGAGQTNLAPSSCFKNVTAGSEDFGLPPGSPLAGAGVDLSPGRTRRFADVSSAAEDGSTTAGCPLGVLAFEVGSAVATFRLFNTMNNTWYDGVDNPYDLSLHVPLASPSATGDWVVLISDTHFGNALKARVGPAIDALNAGAIGVWNRATDGAWVGGQAPCAGRLKHLMNLGDIGPTDADRFGGSGAVFSGSGGNYCGYQDNLWNTSGVTSVPGAGVQSIPHANAWHYTGNHDALNQAPPPAAYPAARLNRHGRATSAYTGSAYADADEFHQFADVGNNRFLLLNYYGSASSNSGLPNTNCWNAADTAWAKWAISTLPASSNLFVMVHAPLGHSTRFGHFDQPHDADLECVISATPWAASFCGHCHGFEPGGGPTWGCIAARADFPTRTTWDVGAALQSPVVPLRRRLRGVRAAGRVPKLSV